MTEIVANSLDSGAGTLHFLTDPSLATLTVVDDGSGMSRRDLVLSDLSLRPSDVASAWRVALPFRAKLLQASIRLG